MQTLGFEGWDEESSLLVSEMPVPRMPDPLLLRGCSAPAFKGLALCLALGFYRKLQA